MGSPLRGTPLSSYDHDMAFKIVDTPNGPMIQLPVTFNLSGSDMIDILAATAFMTVLEEGRLPGLIPLDVLEGHLKDVFVRYGNDAPGLCHLALTVSTGELGIRGVALYDQCQLWAAEHLVKYFAGKLVPIPRDP